MTQISVILPVYNAEKFVEAAVNSILQQTITDFEFIIINDGSTDNSLNILENLAKQDARIKLISRANKGLIATLNEAISISSSDYIARMDADDISMPTRLEKQLAYLKKHPKVAVLGTGYRYMDEAGILGAKRNIFTKYEDIKASFLFGNPIAHPSVMVNYRLLGDKFEYRPEYKTIEDLELWCRISADYQISNLHEVLLHYRILNNSISGKNLAFQIKSAANMLSEQTALIKADNSSDITNITYSYTSNSANFTQFLKACINLNSQNLKNKLINPSSLLKRSLIALLTSNRKNLRS